MRFVIAFLPRSKCLLISWLQSPYPMILQPKKIKSVTVSTFSPSICHEVMGLVVMILVFSTYSFGKIYTKLLSCVQFFVTPWALTHQAPLSMGFSRQESWSELQFPPPAELPDPGIKPPSPAWATWEGPLYIHHLLIHSVIKDILVTSKFGGYK